MKHHGTNERVLLSMPRANVIHSPIKGFSAIVPRYFRSSTESKECCKFMYLKDDRREEGTCGKASWTSKADFSLLSPLVVVVGG
eukprot:scaffold1332_cov166-Amphora_coffeaeformis.AAC.25